MWMLLSVAKFQVLVLRIVCYGERYKFMECKSREIVILCEMQPYLKNEKSKKKDFAARDLFL
jgi:hypothetical protein